MHRCIPGLIAVLMLAGGTASAADDSPPPMAATQVADASFTISGGVVALLIGYEWAHGTLFYQGREYPFKVRGISALDIGAARIVGSGEVFNLKSVADFAGRYAGSTFGSAFSHGASLALFKNENNVTLRARSTVSGLRLNFSGNGIRIRFIAPEKAEDAS